MNKHFFALAGALFAVCVNVAAVAPAIADQPNGPFKLKARQDCKRVPTLDRKSILNLDDPQQFGVGPDEDLATIDAPKELFKQQKALLPPKQARKRIALRAVDQGNGQLQNATPLSAPTDLVGEEDHPPPEVQQAPLPPIQQAAPQPPAPPLDPEDVGDMKLAWDIWHRNVANTIYDRFIFFAKAAFRHSPPLLARMSYTVTRDGRIINQNLNQGSTSVLFNVLIVQTVKSLEGDPVLQFPMGSRRMFVPQSARFALNYGNQGFKYLVGDEETVRTQRR